MEYTYSYYSDEYLQDVISIEGLRTFYNSCSTCGVSWHDDHISLDCGECGGYAMTRPCADCDGKCESVWIRNLALTHEKQKAAWEGECKLINTKTNQMKNSCIISSSATNSSLSQNSNLSSTQFIQTGVKVL